MTEREKGILETALFGVWGLTVFIFVIMLHFGVQLHELEQKVNRLEMSQVQLRQVYTGLTIGKVIDKKEKDGKYTLTIAGYGNFLVKKEIYDESVLGADMPDEIKERVEVKNRAGG
ncbi:DUF1372 family protein [Streptococcus sp. NLN76]|uniref:DUF1372 family protein n=1 Tax=Streptococcus sp. NLN76 TaxID=2822800 RepID=UPI0018ABFA1D|nr:DUF1372 family protein [Streptococcus sp. NLN76]MBF8970177.1 DUF1372 family protein [Streptococcus sp. NLN76]